MFPTDTLLDSISQPIIATDVEGRVAYWNRAAEELYGKNATTVIGRPLCDVLPPDDPLTEPSPLFDALRAGRSWSGTRPSENDGAPVHLTASPIRANGGGITGFAIVFTPTDGAVPPRIDENERKRLESRLLQAERVSSLGRLAASVAHEFNNVLMGIQPFVDLMIKRAGTDPTVKLAAPRIADAVARGKRITQEILRFTRIAEPSCVPVSVAEWLRTLEPELVQFAGGNVTVTIEAGPSLTMLGDVQQLRQVFTNLAVNAHHAMPNGGGLNVRAITDTMLNGDERPIDAVHFTIRDTGVGMTEETLPYIFEPLFTTKKGGTGLGLAIASRVVQQHKGQIYAESTPGDGTTFHILIPASKEAAAATEPDPAPLQHSARPGLHVTLIEDDDSVGAGLAALLDFEGISVDWVRLGAEAIDRITARFPDAVIFDVGLPDVDGVKLYEEIAARWPDLPVLFSTGRGDDNLMRVGHAGKRLGYLQKPYESNDLIKALEELLGP
jgi:PAS domain S-box-containing protein